MTIKDEKGQGREGRTRTKKDEKYEKGGNSKTRNKIKSNIPIES